MPDPTSGVDDGRDSTEAIGERDEDFRDAPELGTDDEEGGPRRRLAEDDDLED